MDTRLGSSQLRALKEMHGTRDAPPLVVAVIDGATAHEAAALERELELPFAALGDPDGVIADQLGIASWATLITLDESGRVTATEPTAQDRSIRLHRGSHTVRGSDDRARPGAAEPNAFDPSHRHSA